MGLAAERSRAFCLVCDEADGTGVTIGMVDDAAVEMGDALRHADISFDLLIVQHEDRYSLHR